MDLNDKSILITGGTGAAPIWTEFMKAATAGTPETDFALPSGVRIIAVDPITGLPPSALQEAAPGDSLAEREPPISVALRSLEIETKPADLLAFEKEQGRALIDSLLREAWDQQAPLLELRD